MIMEKNRNVAFRSRNSKSKIFVGKYRLKYQNVQRPSKITNSNFSDSRPYVFIPSSILSDPEFSICETFSKLGLHIPSAIFHLNRALDPCSWNTKLPTNRIVPLQAASTALISSDTSQEYQRAAQSIFSPLNWAAEDLGEDGEDCVPLLASFDQIRNSNFQKQLKTPTKMWGLNEELTDASKSLNELKLESFVDPIPSIYTEQERKGYVQEILGPGSGARERLSHYHRVLRERSQRFTRNICSTLTKLGAIFRTYEIWTDDYPLDCISQWASLSASVLLGVAETSDFHPAIWEKMCEGFNSFDDLGMFEDEELLPLRLASQKDVLIDTQPFFTQEIKLGRNERTNRRCHSIPNPRVTHMIISDNRALLEQRLNEAAVSGIFAVNGGETTSTSIVEAIQSNRPLICLKYSGGAADLACNILERRDKYLQVRRDLKSANQTSGAYPSLLSEGRELRNQMKWQLIQNSWLRGFDDPLIRCCNQMKVLSDSLPNRFNPSSALVVDIFDDSEKCVQERLVRLMDGVTSTAEELGGEQADENRLTCAWRIRAFLLQHAAHHQLISFFLRFFIYFFSYLSVFSAVSTSYISVHRDQLRFIPPGNHSTTIFVLNFLCLVFSLLTSLFTCIRWLFDPESKSKLFWQAAFSIESEIYQYRARIGKYRPRRFPSREINDNSSSPSQLFSLSLDLVCKEILATKFFFLGASFDLRPTSSAWIFPNESDSLLSDLNRMLPKASLLSQFESPIGTRPPTSYFPSWLSFSASSPPPSNPIEGEGEKEEEEDGVKSIDPDSYFTLRLRPHSHSISKEGKQLQILSSVLIFFTMILVASGSVLASFDQCDLVPLTALLGSVLSSWAQCQELDLKILKCDRSIFELQQIFLWWDGLILTEKKMQCNRDRLVQRGENAIAIQKSSC